MKRISSIILVLMLLLTMLTGCGGGTPEPAAPPEETPQETETPQEVEAPPMETITLRIGHSTNEESDWHKGLEVFKSDLEERTNGQIIVEIYPNETLGSELDVVTQVQQGTAEGIISGESLDGWVPEAAAIALPYAVTSFEGLIAMAESPEIGGVIEQEIIDKVKIRPIGYFIRSARNLTADRRIESIEDLNGFKVRVPNNELSLRLWNGFGATATPLAAGEIFSGLQTGLINGQENPHANNIARSLWEVQDYLILTEHVFGWIYVNVGEDFFQSLTPELQNAVLESGRVMSEFQHQYIYDEVDAQEAMLRERMEFVEIDKGPFIEIAQEVLRDVLEPQVYELYEKALALEY